jgi:hypothetical protein
VGPAEAAGSGGGVLPESEAVGMTLPVGVTKQRMDEAGNGWWPFGTWYDALGAGYRPARCGAPWEPRPIPQQAEPEPGKALQGVDKLRVAHLVALP